MPAHGMDSWSHRFGQNACRKILVSTIVLFAPLAVTFTQAHGSDWGDVPSIKGLDFSKVEIHSLIIVQTSNGRQDTDHLMSHIFGRLAEHKLVGISPDWKAPKPLRSPRLIITLLATEIPGCPDKLLYVKNFELRELAVREREPKVYTDGVSYGGEGQTCFQKS